MTVQSTAHHAAPCSGARSAKIPEKASRTLPHVAMVGPFLPDFHRVQVDWFTSALAQRARTVRAHGERVNRRTRRGTCPQGPKPGVAV